MMIRLLMAGLLLLGGMRGLQACIGEAGHFHLEIAHSHEDHCHGHSHPVEHPESSHCEHSDNHSHVDLSIDESLYQSAHRLALNKGQVRLLVTFSSVAAHGLTSLTHVLLSPIVDPPLSRSTTVRNAALLTIVLRL